MRFARIVFSIIEKNMPVSKVIASISLSAATFFFPLLSLIDWRSSLVIMLRILSSNAFPDFAG